MMNLNFDKECIGYECHVCCASQSVKLATTIFVLIYSVFEPGDGYEA
jgi:hypothetical protein